MLLRLAFLRQLWPSVEKKKEQEEVLGVQIVVGVVMWEHSFADCCGEDAQDHGHPWR